MPLRRQISLDAEHEVFPGFPSGTRPERLPNVPNYYGQQRARKIAELVRFLRENGSDVNRIVISNDFKDGYYSTTAGHLALLKSDPTNALSADLEIKTVKSIDELTRLPSRSGDLVVVETALTALADNDEILSALGTFESAQFKGYFVGLQNSHLVEVGIPIGREVAPVASLHRDSIGGR